MALSRAEHPETASVSAAAPARVSDASASPSVRALPGPLGLVLAYQLVGLALGVVESIQRAATHPEVLHDTYRQSFTVLGAAGTLLGLGAALLALLRRSLRVPAAAFYGTLLAVAAFVVGKELFSGAWISRQWYAPAGPFALSMAALCVGSCGAWLGRAARTRPNWVAPTALGVLGVTLAAADALLLPGLYGALHFSLLLCAWIALVHALIDSPWRPPRWADTGRLRAAAIVVLAVSLPGAFWKAPALSHRMQWDRSPGYAGRLYEQARFAVWRLQVRGLVTRYSPVIKTWLHGDPRLSELRQPQAAKAWNAVAPALHEPALTSLAERSRPHIVVITIDALRADVAATGPHFSALAARGRSFERAYAPASSTDRSLPTLVSGRHDPQQQDENVLLALAKAGYNTSFVSHRFAVDYLRYHEQLWLTHMRTVAGVDEPRGKPTSPQIIRRTLELLRARPAGSPVFTWVHFFDLHEWSRYAGLKGTPRERYESVWHAQDEALGELVSAVASELGDRPIAFVLTSDHGEYLGEGGRTKHTRWVGLPATHIPLVVIAPGRSPEVVQRPAGLFDVAATIAELAGLRGFECESVSLLRDDVDAERPLLMGDGEEIGIVRGSKRLLLAPMLSGVSVFDDSDIAAPRALDVRAVPGIERDLLLPLLGSPMASAAASPLNDP